MKIKSFKKTNLKNLAVKMFCPQIMFLIVLHVGALFLGATGVWAYSYSGNRWSGTSVNYYINSSFASSVRTSMRSADATWDAAGSGSPFRFYYQSTTSRNPNVWAGSCDAHNDVGYYNNGNTGVPAATYTDSSGSGSTIVENDTTFNTYYSWSTSGASGSFDVRSVMTHEFGHWLRLLDLWSSGSPSNCGSSSESTMCGSIATGETRKRSLATDDKNGISFIY